MATQNRQGRRGARRSQAVLAVGALIGLGLFGLVTGDTLDHAAADPATPASDRSDTWPITECGTSSGRGCAPTGRRVDLQRPTFSNPTTITNPLFPVSQLRSVIQVGRVGLVEECEPKDYKQVTIAGRILRETLRKGELPDPRVMRPSTARILIESMKGQ